MTRFSGIAPGGNDSPHITAPSVDGEQDVTLS